MGIKGLYFGNAIILYIKYSYFLLACFVQKYLFTYLKSNNRVPVCPVFLRIIIYADESKNEPIDMDAVALNNFQYDASSLITEYFQRLSPGFMIGVTVCHQQRDLSFIQNLAILLTNIFWTIFLN